VAVCRALIRRPPLPLSHFWDHCWNREGRLPRTFVGCPNRGTSAAGQPLPIPRELFVQQFGARKLSFAVRSPGFEKLRLQLWICRLGKRKASTSNSKSARRLNPRRGGRRRRDRNGRFQHCGDETVANSWICQSTLTAAVDAHCRNRDVRDRSPGYISVGKKASLLSEYVDWQIHDSRPVFVSAMLETSVSTRRRRTPPRLGFSLRATLSWTSTRFRFPSLQIQSCN